MKFTREKAKRVNARDQEPTVWTLDAVRQLGSTTDIETAGAILGIGRTKAYQLAKADQFPVPLLRVGRRYLVPVPPLLRLLDADSGTDPAR